MKDSTIDDLKLRLEAINQDLEVLNMEKKAILSLIAIHEGKPLNSNSSRPKRKISVSSSSISSKVIDAIIELVNIKGQPVTNKEILEYIEQKNISLGNTIDKATSLAAILSAEVRKRDGNERLLKVSRGIFDIKR
jgi:hypothetical protein